MPTKKKPQSVEALDSSATPSTDVDPNLVDVTIETHEAPAKPSAVQSLLSRAKNSILSGGSDEDDLPPARKPARGKSASGYVRPQQREDITTLVSSLLILGIAAINAPDEVKPSDDETGVLSSHLTRILLRHVDLSGRLSGDVLDVIGIIAVMSSWYTRVAPALSAMRANKKQEAASKTIEPQSKAVEQFLTLAEGNTPPNANPSP